ncbi:diacylglycerol/lipid kinase family protein [Derxia gummosa]|uniref:Diacylglycerol/lipid kinase family protein n=1 Tax=Derxia gummosa DSM 723 TaxID=1121388 RepID=A0A8B6XA77_9BURK|nr:diacylglycerol kinase family protein [Derxia gummosa]
MPDLTIPSRADGALGTSPPLSRPGGPADAPPLATAPPLFIVANAGSGRQDSAALAEALAARLGPPGEGRRHQLLLAEAGASLPGLAAEAVRRARASGGVVVAAGGDGTINAVAQQVLGQGVAFGVLPRGTFNYFARSQGVPVDLAEGIDTLAQERPALRRVQAGCVNGRVFLVNASIGLYPRLLEEREMWKQRLGRSRLVAAFAALVSLWREHRPYALGIESEALARPALTLRASTLIVGNNPLQLARLGLPEAEAVVDGELAAFALPPLGPPGLMRVLLDGALGRLAESDDVTRFAFRRMTVHAGRRRARRGVKLALDGEIVKLHPPLLFGVAPAVLHLVVPPHLAGVRDATLDSEATA